MGYNALIHVLSVISEVNEPVTEFINLHGIGAGGQSGMQWQRNGI
jgi:hypothetical protein